MITALDLFLEQVGGEGKQENWVREKRKRQEEEGNEERNVQRKREEVITNNVQQL